MKPGYKTTEFWLSFLIGIWGAIAPGIDPIYQVLIPTFSGGIYTIARGFAKAGLLRGGAGEFLKDK